ncbi:MAG: hypothetical protein QXX56_04920 [Candidatus Bathyarchaeia archaeon]
MQLIKLTVNGRLYEFSVDPNVTLCNLLRERSEKPLGGNICRCGTIQSAS